MDLQVRFLSCYLFVIFLLSVSEINKIFRRGEDDLIRILDKAINSEIPSSF